MHSKLLQEGEGRLTKESKALKTIVFVVGLLFFCLLPVNFCVFVQITSIYDIFPSTNYSCEHAPYQTRLLIHWFTAGYKKKWARSYIE